MIVLLNPTYILSNHAPTLASALYHLGSAGEQETQWKGQTQNTMSDQFVRQHYINTINYLAQTAGGLAA
jgi:hypothetical protein